MRVTWQRPVVRRVVAGAATGNGINQATGQSTTIGYVGTMQSVERRLLPSAQVKLLPVYKANQRFTARRRSSTGGGVA